MFRITVKFYLTKSIPILRFFGYSMFIMWCYLSHNEFWLKSNDFFNKSLGKNLRKYFNSKNFAYTHSIHEISRISRKTSIQQTKIGF